MTETVDVLVVGGGPVGACLAALLMRESAASSKPLSVMVLEPNRPALLEPGSAFDTRVVALSRASEHILAKAGAWSRIRGPRVNAYERMRIWHESISGTSADVLVFDAAEAGEPDLGHIAESRLLQAALLDSYAESGGRIEPLGLRSVHVAEEQVNVRTEAGAVNARLVVGADGVRSAVRDFVGLTADVSDYRQTAIVATIATERAHQNTAWQRFMRDGTLALLPLADGSTSIVWSADDPLAAALLARPASDFEAELDRASDHALGATRLVSERSSFALKGLSAHHYVARRCALIGDAAHVVHPLAGQGVNLGLLDAAALAQLILEAARQREDPGALRVLRRYERWRKSEVAVMNAAIASFDRLLAHGTGPVSRIAQRGLGLVNRSAEIKRFFIRRALGMSGELPRAAMTGGP
ncbi:MAG TPA: FAD-dependent monooxygenase [Steroidobacteraceae bacterium]|nr:FAD-dependent monooxygenase [Steroidobacteraceae bacterium]